MFTRLAKLGAVAALMGSTFIFSGPASAGGFLANTFVKPFSPSAAQALDKAHKDMGNPLDHAANAAAGTAVGTVTANPALGAATGAALEARDAARRGN